jgi:hypothetical protein
VVAMINVREAIVVIITMDDNGDVKSIIGKNQRMRQGKLKI